MRETIGMQQHQGRVALGSLSARPHFFAVGALEKLQGEVTIVEGQVFATGVTANGLPRSLNNDIDGRQATLLVGAEVSEWTDHKFPESMSGAKLEQWIQQQATAVGLDTKQAFPFTISGQLTELRVHVINGAWPVHAKRQNKPIPADHAPFEAELQDLSARVVGIFAQGATGKLTHPGSSLHAHVIYEHESAGQITGHLESLEVAAGAVLRLPVPNAAGD
ncbi:MAG: acetolactate decarboxylase [Planctomycetaceae bacterium]|nr:acetolactate decarboxylase [Planctomycetaceae bacterium]